MDKASLISWDDYFLNIAKAVSLRSSCLKKSIGAVIVGPDLKIKATGYNGAPHGLESSFSKGFCNKEKLGYKSGEGYEVCRSIHAEQNAIIQAGAFLCNGATIYIWGHNFICTLCTKFILQAGIVRAVIQDENTSLTSVSKEDLIKTLENIG